MFEPTGSQRDAASTVNRPDYRVTDALEMPNGLREVVVESRAPPGCPVCGVVSARVHSRRQQDVRDVPPVGRCGWSRCTDPQRC